MLGRNTVKMTVGLALKPFQGSLVCRVGSHTLVALACDPTHLGLGSLDYDTHASSSGCSGRCGTGRILSSREYVPAIILYLRFSSIFVARSLNGCWGERGGSGNPARLMLF